MGPSPRPDHPCAPAFSCPRDIHAPSESLPGPARASARSLLCLLPHHALPPILTVCGPQVLSTFQRTLHRLSPPLPTSALPYPGAEPSKSPSDYRPGPPASESSAGPGMCAGSWGAGPVPVSAARNYDGPEPAGRTGWETPCTGACSPSDGSSGWSGAPSAAGTPMLIVAAGWGSRAGGSCQSAPTAPSGLLQGGPGLDPAHGLSGPGPGP